MFSFLFFNVTVSRWVRVFRIQLLSQRNWFLVNWGELILVRITNSEHRKAPYYFHYVPCLIIGILVNYVQTWKMEPAAAN